VDGYVDGHVYEIDVFWIEHVPLCISDIVWSRLCFGVLLGERLQLDVQKKLG